MKAGILGIPVGSINGLTFVVPIGLERLGAFFQLVHPADRRAKEHPGAFRVGHSGVRQPGVFHGVWMAAASAIWQQRGTRRASLRSM